MNAFQTLLEVKNYYEQNGYQTEWWGYELEAQLNGHTIIRYTMTDDQNIGIRILQL